jgi:putative FmdB family regulatory protein
MPMYDYNCPKCGENTEVIMPMAERDNAVCEACGTPLVRLITGGSFMLLGGGWTTRGHLKIHPPESDPNQKTGWQDNYYNCTPESVHRT